MALAATVQWDVRTTGSDSNGGSFDPGVTSPGTDYSQQNSAQVAYTDLVIGGTNTQLTSAANPFTSAHVGNTIQINSGTGFTVGFYTVASVAGAVATMDRAVGTGGSTSGVGNLGGSLATVAKAVTAAVASNTVHIKVGTYTITSSITFSVSTLSLIGYNAIHNDGGTKPLITTATNGVVLLNTGSSNSGVQIFNNLSLSSTASARNSCIWQLGAHGTAQTWDFVNCVFDGFNRGIDNSNGTPFDVAFIHVTNCEFKNIVSVSIVTGNSAIKSLKVLGCYFHNNNQDLDSSASGVAPMWFEYCIFANCSGSFCMNASNPWLLIDHCTFVNNTNGSQTVSLSSTNWFTSITNTIFYGSTNIALGGAINSGNIAGAAASASNAFGNNHTNYTNWNGSPGDVFLTANPFTNAAAGDYSLNSTIGGGAACKGAAFPGTFPGGLSIGHSDIGAVQSTGSGGGGGGSISGFIG